MSDYYHWTDEETYKEIIRKKNMVQAFFTWIFGLEPHELVPGSGGRDEYGEGVYFTDCGPDLARSTIAGRCFGHSSNIDQVECYFLVNFHGNAKITKERAHVWKLSPKTTATQFILEHDYHPDFEGEEDEDEDWVPSCNKCEDSGDVSDLGGDYYWCSHCEHDIDEDGDCVKDPCSTCDESDDDGSDESTCPWCDEEGMLILEDDEYEGQRIYTCCAVYFDEDGNLWPDENPNGDNCRSCDVGPHALDCAKEMCGNCCEGNCGRESHG